MELAKLKPEGKRLWVKGCVPQESCQEGSSCAIMCHSVNKCSEAEHVSRTPTLPPSSEWHLATGDSCDRARKGGADMWCDRSRREAAASSGRQEAQSWQVSLQPGFHLSALGCGFLPPTLGMGDSSCSRRLSESLLDGCAYFSQCPPISESS